MSARASSAWWSVSKWRTVGTWRNQSRAAALTSQTPTSSGRTGQSSSANQRPKALATSRPMRPAPMTATRTGVVVDMGEGGGELPTSNIQHPTSNNGGEMVDVEGWVFELGGWLLGVPGLFQARSFAAWAGVAFSWRTAMRARVMAAGLGCWMMLRP